MKKKSPLHHQPTCYETEAYGFDLQEGFSQLLEEAKEQANEAKLKTASVHPEECGKTGSKREKSWRSSLNSWWKAHKKSKHRAEPTSTSGKNSESKVSGKRKGPVSCLIYKCGKGPNMKERRPTSGSLTSLFKSTKSEIPFPYMSLRQRNSPRPPHNFGYGPLYVVT